MLQGAENPSNSLCLHYEQGAEPAHLADVEIKCGRDRCEKKSMFLMFGTIEQLITEAGGRASI